MNKNNKEKHASGIGIIIAAALMIELLSLMQYRYLRNDTSAQLERLSATELRIKTGIIRNTLKTAEATMQENLWYIRRNLPHADSMFAVTGRMISANPNIVGGCIAFVPYYYPEKGRFFEPYAHKEDYGIAIEQLGSQWHDYTLNPAYTQTLENKKPDWSNPYKYGDNEIFYLTTYSYPLTDDDGKAVAVCGIDIDLSWLGDTLNASRPYPSSFGLLLTDDAQIVTGKIKRYRTAEQVARLICDEIATDNSSVLGRSMSMTFRDSLDGRKASVYYMMMAEEPNWMVALVNYHDEVYAPVHKSWLRQMLVLLIGLLILFFIIRRFAIKERELRLANLEQARIDGELNAARSIQKQMLPKTFPDGVCGMLEPALAVGGDMFDFFIRDNKLFFCIGDVSGKGVPSAMVMAGTYSMFRIFSEREDSPGKIVSDLNIRLSRSNDFNMFLTFFLGVLELDSGILHYCNAGHEHPFILSGGKPEEIPAVANMPIGAFDDTSFREQSLTLAEGATIFLYTDGLNEAKNAERKLFGMDRVREVLENCPPEPRQMIETVYGAVRKFVDGAPQSDDLTMLAIRYTATEAEG